METFNEKIKRIRKLRGLNQTDVCSKIGITQPSFASIESGKTKSIAIELGKKIAVALNVSFNELFDIESPESNNNLLEQIEQFKKRINELESQIEDKKRLEKYLSNDLLNIKRVILNWVKEFHLTEPDFIKSENPEAIKNSSLFKSLLSESIDKEAELLVACVKVKLYEESEIEKEFGNNEIFSELMLKYRNLL